MTDAEIVAYNTGVAAFIPELGQAPTAERLATLIRETMTEREVTSLDRLGAEMFWAWVAKGAWDAWSGAAR